MLFIKNIPLLYRRLKHLDSTGRFRDSFYYSNLMYGLLTRIAEMLGGKTWEALVKEHIFDPLGMTSSNFATTADPEKLELAKGYIDIYGELKEAPWEFSRCVA
jgi:CubicO group peptidase (beta-lactamase class C family)